MGLRRSRTQCSVRSAKRMACDWRDAVVLVQVTDGMLQMFCNWLTSVRSTLKLENDVYVAMHGSNLAGLQKSLSNLEIRSEHLLHGNMSVGGNFTIRQDFSLTQAQSLSEDYSLSGCNKRKFKSKSPTGCCLPRASLRVSDRRARGASTHWCFHRNRPARAFFESDACL